MADFKIKPASGTGNKLILETQDGTDVMTTSDSGVTLASATLVTPALGIPASGTLTNATGYPATAFPAGTITGWNHTLTAPVAYQGSDLSYTLLTGSSVDYTPTTGSSYVVYEYTTTFTQGDASSLVQIWFNHDSSNVTLTNVSWYDPVNNSNGGMGYKTLKFIIPSWSGSKNCKLNYRAYSTDLESMIHKVKHSGDGSGTDVFCNIYRTTYSVM